MKIYFASDHAGFNLKNILKGYVESLGHEVIDCGNKELDEYDDYPDFIKLAAVKVAVDSSSKGIILGGSGQGEAIVANRIVNIRAVVYYGKDLEIIRFARQHNDSNILSLGARFLSDDEAMEAVRVWLETDFSGEERHIRRLNKIDN